MADIVRVLTTGAVRAQMVRDMGRRRASGSRQRYVDYELPRGQRLARARGILGYRMVRPPGRPDRLIRVAVTRRVGPRGGRTVATSKLELR